MRSPDALARAIGSRKAERLASRPIESSARPTGADIHVAIPRRFSDLAVFDACLDIRVRRIDEPA